MLKSLAGVATKLDSLGLTKEADAIDTLLVKHATKRQMIEPINSPPKLDASGMTFNQAIAARRKLKHVIPLNVAPASEEELALTEQDTVHDFLDELNLSSAMKRLLTTALFSPKNRIQLRALGDEVSGKKLERLGLGIISFTPNNRMTMMTGLYFKLTDQGKNIAQELTDRFEEYKVK
jgi:hypothetical protein